MCKMKCLHAFVLVALSYPVSSALAAFAAVWVHSLELLVPTKKVGAC